MEPLSISTSVVALVGLGVRIARVVWEFRRHGKDAPEEFAELAADISTLRLILQKLELSRASRAEGSGFWDADHLAASLQNCNEVVCATGKKVQAIEQKLQGGTLDRLFITMASSSFRQDLQDLLSRLERSKSSLMLSLQLMSL